MKPSKSNVDTSSKEEAKGAKEETRDAMRASWSEVKDWRGDARAETKAAKHFWSEATANLANHTLVVDGENGSFVDLANIDLGVAGSKWSVVSITLSSESGSFDAASTNKVEIVFSETGDITLTGKLKEIDKFLNDPSMITYLPDEGVPNNGMDTFTLSTESRGETVLIATIDAIVPVVEEPAVVAPVLITGTSDDDTLVGADGVETISGLDGDDTLDGRGGDDTVDGGAGNDVVRGGSGADVLMGGAGEDTLQYVGSISGVTVDLNVDAAGHQSASGGDATGDVISGFENVYSTEFSDTLVGNAGDNVLFGYGGRDVIDGGAGNDVVRGGADADTLTGGAGTDGLRYLGSIAGVTVDLTLNAAGFHQTSGGDAEGDIASGFEDIYGSDFDDVLTGDAGSNYLAGNAGDDTIVGGAGDDNINGGAGADNLNGGTGTDSLTYDGSDVGVTVDMSFIGPQISAGHASGDVLSGFENLSGTNFGDSLTGDDGRNIILGLDGDDIINGGGGNDAIRGGAGADVMVGGAGSDVLQYAGSSAGVTVNLSLGANGLQQASGGDAEGDVISEFENVYGSSFGDVITGNASRNILYGYEGDDVLDGGLGNDALRGSGGADSFVFSTSLGSANVDSIADFNSADDTIMLSNAVFTALGLGELNSAQFASNSTGLAGDADQHVIYNITTGALFYDADGNGSALAVQFATLEANLNINQSDFLVF